MIKNLVTLTSKDEFQGQIALAKYIIVDCKPNILRYNSANGTRKLKYFEKAVHIFWIRSSSSKNTKVTRFDYLKLDLASVRVVWLSDTSLANPVGTKSKLGYVPLLSDGKNA